VHVDERVVAHNLGLVRLDKAYAAHVGGEPVHFIYIFGGFEAILYFDQVEQQELLSGRRLILRLLDVHAADPVAALDQILDEMMADEAARARHQDSCLF
jgi:hypothetical protein